VKRAASALVVLGLTAVTIAPSFAATQQGAVEAKWNVAATASMVLATNYVAATGVQSLGANNLQPSPAGTCTAATTETALTMTYGPLTPSATAEVACNYQRAVLATVITNDSLGYKIVEYEEAAPTTGITFCAFPNGSTASGAGPVSSQATAPTPYTGSACATGGTALIAGTGGAVNSGAQQPGANPATATAPASPYNWVSATSASAGTAYGQDLQINLAANQASSASDQTYIIIELVPN
jgi:hypothetical protein